MTDQVLSGGKIGGGTAARTGDSSPGSSERTLRILAAGLLAFLAYPALELASGGLRPGTMAAVSAAIAVVVGLYLWTAWHRGGPPGLVLVTLAVMIAIGVAVPPLWGSTWVGLLLFPAMASAIVGRRWVGVAVALGLAGLLAGEGVALGADEGTVLSLGLVMALGGAGAAGFVRLLETNASLSSTRAELARLAAAEERHRLAMDLHDAVKQELFVASMEIGTTQANLGSDPAGASMHLVKAARAIARAKEELSGLIGHTRPAIPSTVELAGALSSLVAEWSQRHGIATSLAGDAPVEVPGPLGDALVRATGEALANVARHARASRVRVSVTGDDRGVEVQVKDDGRGFDPSRSHGGHGLAIMADRLGAVDATMKLRSVPGQGTEVVLCWAATTKAWVSR